MNKVKKVWLLLSNPYTLNKNFTASYYQQLIGEWKEKFGFISFTDDYSKTGILLRHDIDDDLDKSVRMAEIEAGLNCSLNDAMFKHGCIPIVQSTYFVLNTAKYWKCFDMIDCLSYIQRLGHHIGWHNNSIADWYRNGGNIYDKIQDPLNYLRQNNIEIDGTAAHGDRLCYNKRFINYNVFGFRSPGWNNYGGPEYKLSEFYLKYEAYHVPYDNYIADCHIGWNGDFEKTKNWTSNKRYQVLIHPQNFRI